MAEWQGRLGVTCNADEESALIIPDLSQSILDKLMLFRAQHRPGFAFPPRYELKKILDRELPWLARWLLDHKIPADLQGSSRFGVIHYAEPSLLDTAKQSSRSAGFTEILEDWKAQYFTLRSPTAKTWTGTSYQLHKEILLDPTSEAAMRPFSVDAIGRHLAALKNKEGSTIEAVSTGETRGWVIHRDTLTKTTTK
jgi:hypothetical protein